MTRLHVLLMSLNFSQHRYFYKKGQQVCSRHRGAIRGVEMRGDGASTEKPLQYHADIVPRGLRGPLSRAVEMRQPLRRPRCQKVQSVLEAHAPRTRGPLRPQGRRALSSQRGLKGAPEVPPLCRETQSLGQQMLNAPLGINGLNSIVYIKMCNNIYILSINYDTKNDTFK